AGCLFEDRVGRWEDAGELKAALRGCEAAVNLAACASLVERDRTERERVNVGLPRALCAALREAAPRARLLHCSTAGTAGLGGPAPRDESAPFDAARIHYFATKRAGEELVLEAARGGLDAVVVNPTTVFGPRMRPLQAAAFRRAAEGRMLACPPGGSSFVYAPDVCAGASAALARGRRGERYILGGENLTFRDYFTRVAAVAGKPGPRFALPPAALPVAGALLGLFDKSVGADTGRLAAEFGYYRSEKAERELGYRRTDLGDALRATYQAVVLGEGEEASAGVR
ncbi:MAG TPA: NAD-dependent epimerase/dehydratase family protein, partial [Elusimicrobiota bacterium]|nr:NAD-dependent epimerase/dehydratase family protein [Elusimicrobiota bacterium]